MKPITCHGVAVSLLVLLTVGCTADSPTLAPVPDHHAAFTRESAGPDRYPLQIGNRWTYEGDFVSLDSLDTEWSGLTVHSTEVDEIIGTEVRFDREYMLTRKNWRDDYGGGYINEGTYWLRSRQDRAGLYEADIASNTPPGGSVSNGSDALAARLPDRALLHGQYGTMMMPATAIKSAALRAAYNRMQMKLHCAALALDRFQAAHIAASPPGGSGSGELVRLVYPLRPGLGWDLGIESFRYRLQVEGHELLDLPAGKTPAWRIRGTFDLMEAGDSLLFWYGKDGYLGYFFHATGTATDQEGNELGKFVTETTQRLTSFTPAAH